MPSNISLSDLQSLVIITFFVLAIIALLVYFVLQVIALRKAQPTLPVIDAAAITATNDLKAVDNNPGLIALGQELGNSVPAGVHSITLTLLAILSMSSTVQRDQYLQQFINQVQTTVQLTQPPNQTTVATAVTKTSSTGAG